MNELTPEQVNAACRMTEAQRQVFAGDKGTVLTRPADQYVGFHADWRRLDLEGRSGRFIQGDHAADNMPREARA